MYKHNLAENFGQLLFILDVRAYENDKKKMPA